MRIINFILSAVCLLFGGLLIAWTIFVALAMLALALAFPVMAIIYLLT